MCDCMFWMVCSPSRGLVSPCPFTRGFVYPCLPLFPYTCACVWWCVRPPSRRLVSPFCLPLSFPIYMPVMICLPDGISAFPRSCLSLSLLVFAGFLLSRHNICLYWMAIISRHVCLSLMVPQPWCVRLPAVLFPLVCLFWMVWPPSQGLVSPYFPSPCLSLGWCVRLLDVLFALVSHCFLLCEPVLDGLSVSLRSCLHLSSIFSHCPLNCLPLSPFLSSRCLRLRFIVSHCFLICITVLDGDSDLDYNRLQETLSPHVSHCFPHVCLCWMLCPPSRGLVSFCLPLSPHIYICLCWTVYPISQGLVSPSFLFFFYMCACNILCWMVRPPSRGFVSLVSQLVSQLVFLLVSQLGSQFVCFLISLCGGWSDFAFFSNNELIGVLNAFLRCPPWCWTVCPPARGLVS